MYNRGINCYNTQVHKCDKQLYTLIKRGVAQLVARAVWDREVEGSSPFTPTKEKRLHLCSLFSLAGASARFFDASALADASRWFGH